MYTKKHFERDLYNLSTGYYIKREELRAYILDEDEDSSGLKEELRLRGRDLEEVEEILEKLQAIKSKIQIRKGFDEDPVDRAKELRKEARLDEAFELIYPYVKDHREELGAKITFGWIIYDYLKNYEGETGLYFEKLKVLYDNVQYSFSSSSEKILLNRLFFSFNALLTNDNSCGDRLFGACLELAVDSFSRVSLLDEELPAVRILVKSLIRELGDDSYFRLMDQIGFDWFGQKDFETSFTNKEGVEQDKMAYAEWILGQHSRRLLDSPSELANQDRLEAFIEVLGAFIVSKPGYRWLPYYRTRLLARVGRKEEALTELIRLVGGGGGKFYEWDQISELVEEDDSFRSLCAGLVSGASEEKLLSLQEKIIPMLIERQIYNQAKYELDLLIATSQANSKAVAPELLNLKEQEWYLNNKPVNDRSLLEPFAREAREILKKAVAYTDAFISFVNESKDTVHFAYLESLADGRQGEEIKSGFFFRDRLELDYDWRSLSTVKLKFEKDPDHDKLYHILGVRDGDENFIRNFLVSEWGYVDKRPQHAFAFVNSIFISPKLVEENQLEPGMRIHYTSLRSYNKNKDQWLWKVEEIDEIER